MGLLPKVLNIKVLSQVYVNPWSEGGGASFCTAASVKLKETQNEFCVFDTGLTWQLLCPDGQPASSTPSFLGCFTEVPEKFTMIEQFLSAGGEGFLMGQHVFTEGSSLDVTLYLW